MSRYLRLLRYALRQWRALSLIAVLTAIGPAVTALTPWPMKLLVDCALGGAAVPAPVMRAVDVLALPHGPLAVVAIAGLASVLLYVVSSAVEATLSYAWTTAGRRMVAGVSADMLARLQRLSPTYHSRHHVGDLLTRLSGDSWSVHTVVYELLASPVQNVLMLVTVGWVAWRLDRQLTILSLAVAPVLALAACYFGPRLGARALAYRQAESRLASLVHQTLGAIPLVQTFGTQGRHRAEFDTLAGDAAALARRRILLDNSYSLVTGLVTTVGVAVVLYVGGLRVLGGAMTLGSLLVFVAYQQVLQGAAQGLVRSHAALKGTGPGIDRVLEILDSEECVRDRPGARPLVNRGGLGVRFEGVTFGYGGDGGPVLSGVDLDVPAGSTVAVVGPSGAGKSTLAALVPRFFDPTRGRVLVGGQDVRDLQLRSLREQVGLVLQEPVLFPTTIAENIAYGRPGATRREVEEAARAAGAHEFVARLPGGYDAVVGERGATLSGGERQRVAIARALLKAAPVLVLDEPTSALDARTEANLLEVLGRLARNRTALIIAHRLSTIRHADLIAVLNQGRVVEAGTHAELMTRDGLYAEMYRMQVGEPEREVVA